MGGAGGRKRQYHGLNLLRNMFIENLQTLVEEYLRAKVGVVIYSF